MILTTKKPKYFQNIVFEQHITVYTDHLNLTYNNAEYNRNHILYQWLLLEEHGVRLVYIKGCSSFLQINLSWLSSTAHGEELFKLDPHKPEFVLDAKVITRK